MGGRYIPEISHFGTNNEACRSCLEVQGCADYEKNMMFHQIDKMRPQSMRLIVRIKSIIGHSFWRQHVTKDNIQKRNKLERDACVKQKRTIVGTKDDVLKLKTAIRIDGQQRRLASHVN